MNERKNMMTNADLPLNRANNGNTNFSFGNTMLKNRGQIIDNQYKDITTQNDNIQHFIRSKNNSFYKLDLSNSYSDQPIDATTEEQE